MNIKYLLLKLSLRRRERKYLRALKSVPKQLNIYFGVPGSGKTTYAAYLAKRDLKRGLNVWSNVPITGTMKLDPLTDIGINHIQDGRVIIDEAGIEYNNRNFKTFPETAKYFYKYHRHYNTAVDIFSQGYDDMDITLRRLARNMYVVKQSIIPFFTVVRRISRKVGINEQTKDICDEYYFVPFSRKYIFNPLLWNSFNTLSRKQLPQKNWENW